MGSTAYIAEIELWTDNVFKLSFHTYESLIEILNRVDYGIFIMTPDDFIKYRGQDLYAPRDNVVFELGLFCGKIGLKKTFIVLPRELHVKLPSNLQGIHTASYERHSSGSLSASLAAACTKISLQIDKKTETRIDLNWSELCSSIQKLSKNLKRAPDQGGFVPDVLLGISRGGIIIADLLHRCLGAKSPVLCLWADRNFFHPKTIFAPPENKLNLPIISTLKYENFRNVLIVDDITRSGRTLLKAKEFLVDSLPSKNIKTSVIVLVEGDRFLPDYCVVSTKKSSYKMPFEQVC